MSQETDLQAIRDGVNVAQLPVNVRTAALWHLDKLPDLYQKLAKTNESRFLDEIQLHVKSMLNTIVVSSSVETMTNDFREMHERNGIPTLGIKPPVAAAVKKSRAKKVAATGTL